MTISRIGRRCENPSDKSPKRGGNIKRKVSDEEISEYYLAKKAQKKALLVVSEWELAEARKRDALELARVSGEQLPSEVIGEERGLHAGSIEADVKNLLQGKAYVELDKDYDKYRPRKPKYFNRVHTGYHWNKYNQTHYDHDNPPPKFVQGYKFDIFYPDLADKSKAPTYTITKDGDRADTCIITFHAGPPYEEIAFRIVSEEWDYSNERGFKCTFESGILHVYFNFKRYRYRR